MRNYTYEGTGTGSVNFSDDLQKKYVGGSGGLLQNANSNRDQELSITFANYYCTIVGILRNIFQLCL
jgi:hypothetical protein